MGWGWIERKLATVFPRNLAEARFYFNTLFDTVIIQGRLDFEGGIYRDQHAHTYTASIMSLFICSGTSDNGLPLLRKPP